MNTWLLFPALCLIAGIAALTPLGSQVLRRGVVFIDLAVAQVAVLWVDGASVSVLVASALCVLVLGSKPWLGRDSVFYAAFAVVASVAVPALGLFLVFASLIAPALWIEKGVRPWVAMAMASIVCLLALLVSWMLDTPSGPTVVLMLAAFGVGALFYRQNAERYRAD